VTIPEKEDHDRKSPIAGDIDLRLEGAPLLGPAGGLAVVVDPGLADRPHLLVLRREAGDLLGPRIVETGGLRRVTANGREDRLVALGCGNRQLVGVQIEADVEHPFHPRLPGRRDDLGLGPLAEKEVGVGIDHGKPQPILAEDRRHRSRPG